MSPVDPWREPARTRAKEKQKTKAATASPLVSSAEGTSPERGGDSENEGLVMYYRLGVRRRGWLIATSLAVMAVMAALPEVAWRLATSGG